MSGSSQRESELRGGWRYLYTSEPRAKRATSSIVCAWRYSFLRARAKECTQTYKYVIMVSSFICPPPTHPQPPFIYNVWWEEKIRWIESGGRELRTQPPYSVQDNEKNGFVLFIILFYLHFHMFTSITKRGCVDSAVYPVNMSSNFVCFTFLHFNPKWVDLWQPGN